MEYESTEIETRLELNGSTSPYEIVKALPMVELVREVEGTDFYWGWEESIKDGVWRRIRDHRVTENGNGRPHSYQVRQTKTRIPSPTNAWGIEFWEESYPIDVDAQNDLELLRKQGYSLLEVKAIRRSYCGEFEGGKIEINCDLLQSGERCVEFGLDVYHSNIIPGFEFLQRFMVEDVSKVLKQLGIEVRSRPIYPLFLLTNGQNQRPYTFIG